MYIRYNIVKRLLCCVGEESKQGKMIEKDQNQYLGNCPPTPPLTQH